MSVGKSAIGLMAAAATIAVLGMRPANATPTVTSDVVYDPINFGRAFAFNNVSINGAGIHVYVSPGAALNVTFDYALGTQNTSYCFSCILQSYAGWSDGHDQFNLRVCLLILRGWTANLVEHNRTDDAWYLLYRRG